MPLTFLISFPAIQDSHCMYDLLKPGGYMRLHQYFGELNKNFGDKKATNTNDYILRSSGSGAAFSNLSDYSDRVLRAREYRENI